MVNNIKVSVIVPVYKVPKKFLEKCINSLINQTLKDIEIIIVDDGSMDECSNICDQYSKEDNRIRVIHKSNGGLCSARNDGVKIAKGEWISFIDGDDWIEEDAYNKLYMCATADEDIDVVMFGYVKDYKNKSINMDYKKYFSDNKIYKSIEEIKYIQTLILNYNANCAMVPTKFINKNFLINNNLLHDEELRQGAEGIEFNIRLFAKAKKVKFIDKNFYHYEYNDKSITTTHDELNHKMVLDCFRKIKDQLDYSDKKMMKWFYNRINYVILTTAVSGYFSATNKERYSIKKKKFKKYLKDDLVVETFKQKSTKNMGLARKIALLCIKYHLFLLVNLISKIRLKQKQ